MYKRKAETTLKELLKYYPVIAITGPRQSGKTTLSRAVFPNKTYVSLEDLAQREFAKEDPMGFLQQSKSGLIIDEAQNCPELFSYIQGYVDENKSPGQFILTGSQQFGLMSGITQSLAGRVGLLELLSFSLDEIGHELDSLNNAIYTGFYPPIYDRKIPPQLWYEDYIKTYLERDVRKLIGVKDLSVFQKFLGLCAARSGQLLNYSELSNALGLDTRTIKSWVSVLEASYIIFLLQPYYRNFSKRLVKSPKLYFYDSGLLCHLLRLRKEDLEISPYRGSLFEAMIISEFKKYIMNNRADFKLYFWRDSNGVEVDLIFEQGPKSYAAEIKSGQTIHSNFFSNLKKYSDYAGNELTKSLLIYGGLEKYNRNGVLTVSWKEVSGVFGVL